LLCGDLALEKAMPSPTGKLDAAARNAQGVIAFVASAAAKKKTPAYPAMRS